MREIEEKHVVGLVILGIVVLLFFGIRYEKKRQVWLNQHCSVIGQISGSSGLGTAFGSNGQVGFVSTYVTGKTGYQCDDGKIYWE